AYGSAATAQTSSGGRAAATSTAYGNTAAGKTSSGDMYAAHDGNVYKNTGSGWQSYNNGSWNNVQKPTTSSAQSSAQQHPAGDSGSKPSGGSSYGDAQQEAQNRARGTQQTQHF